MYNKKLKVSNSIDWIVFCLIVVKCPVIAFQSEGLIIKPLKCTKPSTELDYATECHFACKSGYQLQGPGLKTCAQNKNWIPVGNPSCKGAFSLFCYLILIFRATKRGATQYLNWCKGAGSIIDCMSNQSIATGPPPLSLIKINKQNGRSVIPLIDLFLPQSCNVFCNSLSIRGNENQAAYMHKS